MLTEKVSKSSTALLYSSKELLTRAKSACAVLSMNLFSRWLGFHCFVFVIKNCNEKAKCFLDCSSQMFRTIVTKVFKCLNPDVK